MATEDFTCPACELDVDPQTEPVIPVRMYARERDLGSTFDTEIHGEHREYAHRRCGVPRGYRRDT